MRSFLGILAGFFTVPIVSVCCDLAFHAIHPAYGAGVYIGGGMALIVMIYGNLSVLLGGYVTGMISRGHYVRNGLILGILGLLIAAPVHIFKIWHLWPVWFHIADLLLVVPVAIYGAHLAGKRQQNREAVAA